MPTVGGKKYPYTKAGEIAAKKHAKKVGKPVKRSVRGAGKKPKKRAY